MVPFAAALVLVMAGGCGLADYEQRMDAQRARMKLFDEESRQLGEVIEIPTRKEGEKDVSVWPFEVFLRLPKGYNATPKEYVYNKLVLCRYPGKEGYNVFVAAGYLVERRKDNKYQASEWPVEDFRLNVRGTLQEFYKQEMKFLVTFPKADVARQTLQPTSWQAEKLPSLALEREIFTDEINTFIKEHSVFRVYHHQNDKHQIAVVYQYPKAQDGETALNTSIDWSIKSLDIGVNAAGKRSALSGRKLR